MVSNTPWPPDYNDEYVRRNRILFAANNDRVGQRILKSHYKHNCIEFINDWCVTFDPRIKPPEPKLMPFRLFPKQEEFITFLTGCLNDRESGLVEKARDIGASWLCCAFSVWLWLYHDGSTIGWGSRKEEYVDKKGDPKAIFPKIRQIIEHLPAFMLPDGFDMAIHATHMKIINPVNGASITGEAGDNIGRGGRTTIYFKDESAHYEHPEMIEAALGDNTEVQIDISSVNGSNNVFYHRRFSKESELWTPTYTPPKGKTRVFIFDWRDHPNKTQDWYDTRRKKAEGEGLLHLFAQEVDRDYSGSVDRVIIPAVWSRACIDAHKKLGIRADGERTAGQDIADEGGDKNALAIRHGVILQVAQHWGGEAGEAAVTAVPICQEHRVRELYYDSIGVGSAFKTKINQMREEESIPKMLRVLPWNAGATPLDPEDPIIADDPISPNNEDQYENLKAQSWWRLRTRIYKTYRAITFGEVYPHDELISFPSEMENVQQVITELSQAVHKYSKKGKTMIDKKPDGARSPNLADAVVMCYNPTRELSILDVL